MKGTAMSRPHPKVVIDPTTVTATIIDAMDLTPGEIWEAMVDTLGIPVTPEQRAKNTTTKRHKT